MTQYFFLIPEIDTPNEVLCSFGNDDQSKAKAGFDSILSTSFLELRRSNGCRYPTTYPIGTLIIAENQFAGRDVRKSKSFAVPVKIEAITS